MDDVFKALSDESRRLLLDSLKKQDGQTLSNLEKKLPDMSRFGVMKHLGILENAGLITTRKEGRFKYHYLNPVPIQEVADRWISRFAVNWTQGLTDLKTTLEEEKQEERAMTKEKPKHVFKTIIQTDKEKLWKALTSPELIKQYFFGLDFEGKWEVGEKITYINGEGKKQIEGRVMESIPYKRIVHSFQGMCQKDEADQEPPSCVTFEIEDMGTACTLTLIHDEFEVGSEEYVNVGNGWPTVLSGLKTLLETGKPLIMDAA